jgi:guanine deaminase
MKLFIGPLVHTLNPTTIQYSELSIIGVSSSGTIDFAIHHVKDKDSALKSALESEENKQKGWAYDKVDVVVLNHGEFLCPGFIDTHTHGECFLNLSNRQTHFGKFTLGQHRNFLISLGGSSTSYWIGSSILPFLQKRV